jgi:putative colanic acid biosynthesis acetyltransferase WcaF
MSKIDLSRNVVPDEYSRGRSSLTFLLWLVVQQTLFNWAPRPFDGWRRFWLRLFGAKIGRNVRVRPHVTVEFPWRLSVGENSSIGEHAWLYSVAPIAIGNNCVISQYAKLVTGSHDIRARDFSLVTAPINVSDNAWVCANAFVGPGVSIGEGAVLGACSCTFEDIPPWTVFCGMRATYLGDRTLLGFSEA